MKNFVIALLVASSQAYNQMHLANDAQTTTALKYNIEAKRSQELFLK